jgi:hypothetical protein
MLQKHITHRLQETVLLPELQQALQRMAAYDQGRIARNRWSDVVPTIQRLLGGSEEAIAPFTAAWSLLYAATIRLDQLQDSDSADDPFPVEQLNAQYHLCLSYYVLSHGLLDLLSPDCIPIHRILRLRRLWNDMVLRMASGQYRDLTICHGNQSDSLLDVYQELAQAKTGAVFALAFGGVATLLTDDTQIIDVLIVVGEMYGTLLQCSDDLLDRDTQLNTTLTLYRALITTHPSHISDAASYTPQAFGDYLYRAYLERIGQLLAYFPADVQQGILNLFTAMFESHQDKTGN